MGPLATAAFLQTLTLETPVTRDQEHLHVIVESDPTIPDRTAFLVGEGPDPRPAITAVARRLADAGARLLVIPCNTANVFAREIEAAVGVPIVPWIDAAVASVAERAPRRVGILGTTGTLRSGVYQAALRERGIDQVLPDDGDQRVVMDVIYGAAGVKATGRAAADLGAGLLVVGRRLVEDGAEALLLACTELPLAIPADDPAWPVPVVDPAVEVARRVVALARATT